MTRNLLTCSAIAAACALAAPAADGATRFTIRGAGFGHGVGMSQYGAYGFAMQGAGYRDILAHYYTGTALGAYPRTTARVLLQSVAVARVSGASRAGTRRLNPARSYGIRRGRAAGTVDLLSPTGRRMRTYTAPVSIRGSGGSFVLRGRAINGVTSGAYRGTLEVRPSGFAGVLAVNAVDLEDYVRGVVARESPSHWPAEALKAQAVAARTYAVTTSKGGDGWDHYPDVRSQVYAGVQAETEPTDAAVAATAREVVTYGGVPVVTYFFSTSGGRTEHVENTSLGDEPLPWLKSVEDPYDDASPRHRWGPYRWRMSTAARRLGSLVQGRFRGVHVVSRGESPRIVEADVVGTGGRTRVTGATLRARLGLYDTWAYFTTITTGRAPAAEPEAGASPTGGATVPEARSARLSSHRLTGRVFPVERGADVAVQRREGRRWVAVGSASAGRRGRFAFAVDRPGRYRVRYGAGAGPSVRVR